MRLGNRTSKLDPSKTAAPKKKASVATTASDEKAFDTKSKPGYRPTILHRPANFEPGERVLRILKAQDEFENYVADKIKNKIGLKRLNRLKEKIRSNRGMAIRLSDIAFTTMSAPVTGTISAITAMAIYAEDPHASPFFIQERVGQDKGKPPVGDPADMDFEIHKLRSLYAKASGKDFIGVPGKDDPRISKLGKIARKTSVDELPQLWDVIRGEMSLVGPRPWLRKEFETLPESLQERRSKFKPGITSIASLRGNKLTLIERAQLDVEFMENMSLLGYYITILSTMKNKASCFSKKTDAATYGN